MFSKGVRGGKSPSMDVSVSTGGACDLRWLSGRETGVPGADAASVCLKASNPERWRRVLVPCLTFLVMRRTTVLVYGMLY